MTAGEWVIEPFDKSRHDRADLDCQNDLLNDWLQTKVSQYERKNLARTYVLVQTGHTSVKGYYSLSNHTVVFDALPETQSKGLPRIDAPVVLMGRLAVDSAFHGQKLGEFLLLDALRKAEHLSRTVGVQAVEVDAINDSSRAFYEKYGFLSLKDDPRHLYLPMKVIRSLKLPPSC